MPADKVGCVFSMVLVTILPHAEFGQNGHREDAPHFNFINLATMRDKLDLVADMEGFLEWNSDMSRTCGIKCEPYDRTKHKVSVQSKEILDEEKLTRNEKRRKLRYERKIEEWISPTQLWPRPRTESGLKSNLKHLKRKKLESKIQKREKEDLNFDENHISKKVRIETIKNKMENLSREKNLAIAFDLGWSESMNKKEISKLANQLARIHGANKKDENSAKIYFTNFKKTSDLYQECVRKHAGFEQFPIELRIVSI